MTELLNIDHNKYNLTPDGLKKLQEPYKGMDKKYLELIPNVDEILSKKEITLQLISKAKVVKGALVKIRTWSERIKKKEKEIFLRWWDATQAVYNKVKETIKDKEDKLDKVIKHFENIEIQRKRELRLERIEQLNPYNVENILEIDLWNMDALVFSAFLANSKSEYEEKIKQQKRKAEKEKEERGEKEKLRKENEKLKRENEAVKKQAEEDKKKEIKQTIEATTSNTITKDTERKKKTLAYIEYRNSLDFDKYEKEEGKIVFYKKVWEFII